MQTAPRKRGRPTARHRLPDGTEIIGLTRRADGRWRISETGETFTAASESEAVAHFFDWQAKRQGTTTPAYLATAEAGNMGELIRAVNHVSPARPTVPPHQLDHHAPDTGNPVTVTVLPDGGYAFHRDTAQEAAMWAWCREQIATRLHHAAKQLGIDPDVLANARIIRPGTRLEPLGDLYANKSGLSSNEASRTRLMWKEFCRAVGVTSAKALTREAVLAYEQTLNRANLSAKSIIHRHRKVKTVLNYALKRGEGDPAELRRALDLLKILEAPKVDPAQPRPITPAEFWKVYDAAKKAGDTTYATLLLTALNCALYSSEVAALEWSQLDLKVGELSTRRSKTGVVRVAILWPETVKALKALTRYENRDEVFHTSRRSFTTFSVLEFFRRYREAAKLGEDVKFSGLRDAAFTTACGVSMDEARVLMGHKMPGVGDNYLQRNPGFVRKSCEAIRKAFNIAKHTA
jgi:integrase